MTLHLACPLSFLTLLLPDSSSSLVSGGSGGDDEASVSKASCTASDQLLLPLPPDQRMIIEWQGISLYVPAHLQKPSLAVQARDAARTARVALADSCMPGKGADSAKSKAAGHGGGGDGGRSAGQIGDARTDERQVLFGISGHVLPGELGSEVLAAQ